MSSDAMQKLSDAIARLDHYQAPDDTARVHVLHGTFYELLSGDTSLTLGDLRSLLSTHTATGAGPVGEAVAFTSRGQLDALKRGSVATMAGKGDEFFDVPLYTRPVESGEAVAAEGRTTHLTVDYMARELVAGALVVPLKDVLSVEQADALFSGIIRALAEVARPVEPGEVEAVTSAAIYAILKKRLESDRLREGHLAYISREIAALCARPVEPGEVERDEAPQTDGGFLTKGERAAIDKLGEATALRRELAEARGLIRDAIGLVPLAHQNWHTDARTALGDALEAGR